MEEVLLAVTGSRRYSGDLPQGGLEVPCLLKFEGNVTKAEKLIKSALSSASSENGPVKDKRKDEDKTRAESPANQKKLY